MAVSRSLGKVSIAPKGPYSAAAQYVPLDAVSNAGGGWLCLKSAYNIEPGVTTGWETYWMSLSKGIKSVDISAPATGQTKITITCSDETEYSFTFNNQEVADNSITTAMLQNEAVTQEKIAPKAVTPTQLDRSYATLNSAEKVTPTQASSAINYVNTGTSITLTLADAGTMILAGISSGNVIVPSNETVAFPIGTEIEVCQWATAGPITITGASGVALVSLDSKFTIAGNGGCVALKKLDTNTWVLAGALK